MIVSSAIELRALPDDAGGWRQALGQAEGDLVLVRDAGRGHALLCDSPVHAALGRFCRETGRAVLLSYREACSGREHRSLMLVDETGRAVANYRTSHLAGDADGLTPGAWLTVAPWAGARLGLMGGADLYHPEVARALALQGAEMLVWVGQGTERAAEWCILGAARAIENRRPLVAFGQDLQSFAAGDVDAPAAEAAAGDAEMRQARRPVLYRSLLLEIDGG